METSGTPAGAALCGQAHRGGFLGCLRLYLMDKFEEAKRGFHLIERSRFGQVRYQVPRILLHAQNCKMSIANLKVRLRADPSCQSNLLANLKCPSGECLRALLPIRHVIPQCDCPSCTVPATPIPHLPELHGVPTLSNQQQYPESKGKLKLCKKAMAWRLVVKIRKVRVFPYTQGTLRRQECRTVTHSAHVMTGFGHLKKGVTGAAIERRNFKKTRT